ncbi:precorrin-6Y C5,15-methyltransferase (decarboxylating) subunit CbiT [Acetohalobium arabaticum]|uniref:Precorrin-6Y C5,15-methyltransferase (Decarboxylating), CbiT subunit n=1 Tax=Acetohalobium arabaticum (strain ATCC 49924 / DSM 5501 / Z-7288) TaxID=574087 RepID=D9QVV9_ACEAZ|nr:precorrin-6Y C5,15-methyltransferase (decarboxylating) subunit CbiT [Acetohalobium arabaticum]ADL12368.1 precorrin-6Y C5,15-methyltransferase (decarboxylating), CbiT subunit [Acetohalobium arabaticum DSM 5501]
MSKWRFQTPGIPDDLFIRGDLPMTKEEVRAVTISKLRLKRDSVVWDIGAGTGSLSIEAGLIADQGSVWAVERESEGIELINQNCEEFGVENIEPINGEAPAALADLPAADRIIIGGSGGQLEEILAMVDKKMTAEGRVVLNAITLETLLAAKESLSKMDYSFNIVTVSITRTREIGNYHMLDAQNPIYIIAGERRR